MRPPLEVFPVRPRGVRDAIAGALRLRQEDRELAATRWSDALSAVGVQRRWSGVRFGSRFVDSRQMHVDVPVGQAFEPIERIGGRTGWYYGNALRRLRGMIDLLLGGVGLRRGRPDPAHRHAGDTLDCWRVETITPQRRLRLQAEMEMPGRAPLLVGALPGASACLRGHAPWDRGRGSQECAASGCRARRARGPPRSAGYSAPIGRGLNCGL